MNANELAELADVADEFLYRYADEGGNFKDPFLNAVYIQLCQQHHAMKALEAKTLTDAETALKSLYEAVIRYENLSPFPDNYAVESCKYQLHDAKEKAKAILKKASER